MQLPDGQPGLRTSDLLGALSLAADLALGLPPEHVLRSCYIGMRIAEELHVPAPEQLDVYYASLLMDVGCTAWTSQFAAVLLGDEIMARQQFVFFVDPWNPLDVLGWMRDYLAPDQPLPTRVRRGLSFAAHGRASAREGFRNTCEVAHRFAGRLGMPESVQRALLCVFEQWDGSGPRGARGSAIPLAARIVYAASFFEVFQRVGGAAAAIRLARRKRGHAFDPAVVDTFLHLSESTDFWSELQHESVWDTVRSMEPASEYRLVGSERLEEVAFAFADFADLKSPDALGHSRRVADLAERVGHRLGLRRSEVTTIRLAGLLHDLGLVAVPSHTLAKPHEQLSHSDWERVRLHPYHAERILARVPAFGDTVPLVAAHHERFDGGGYPRGTAAAELPIGARVLSVVDRFDELRRSTSDASAVLVQMTPESGGALCPRAFRALCDELASQGVAAPTAPREQARSPRAWPAGLTDREVEILRLLATRASRRDIAAALFLSEHTVRHHLEHIYTKLGVETRVAAVLFAVENELLEK